MTLSTAPVVGAPNQEHWPQVFHHALDAQTVFVAAFCVADSSKNREKGHKFIDQLQALPFNNIASLSTTLQKFSQDPTKNIQSFAAGLFVGDKAYLWSWNRGRVALRRAEKKGTIIDSDLFKVVSGSVKPNDMYILGTETFFKDVPVWDIRIGDTVEDFADQTVIELQKSEVQSKSAGYVLMSKGKVELVVNQTKAPLQSSPLSPVSTTSVTKTVFETAVERSCDSYYKIITFLKTRVSLISGNVLNKLEGVKINDGKSKKTRLIIISIVAGTLLVFGILIFSAYKANQRDKQVSSMLQPFQQQLNEAKAAFSQNPADARGKTSSLLTVLHEQDSRLKKKRYEEQQLVNFTKTVQEYYNSISGEKTLDPLPLFYNFQLVKSAFIAKHVAIEGSNAVFADPEGSAIQLNFNTKPTQQSAVDVGGVSVIQDVAIKDKVMYFLGSGADGLGIYSGGKLVSKTFASSDNPTILRLFGSSAYVYLKDAGELMKLALSNGVYGEPKAWLKTSQGLDRKSVTSMAIDGKVWLTTAKGELFSFAQGSKESLKVSGMLSPFSGPTTVYTTPDLQFLYILEPSQHRLVVLDKTGAYQKQFVSNDIGVTTDVIVSQDGKTAYLLAGSVAYSVGLE